MLIAPSSRLRTRLPRTRLQRAAIVKLALPLALASGLAATPLAHAAGEAQGDAIMPASSGSFSPAGFANYLQLLVARARAQGVSEPTIARMTSDLTYNPRVIALDQAQLGVARQTHAPIALARYLAAHLTARRIEEGRAMRAGLAGAIPGIEARYGVPAGIALAIWGNESDYGRNQGDFDLARSLATLAYDGRRRTLFADEFVALLRIADTGVPRTRLVGSWAGAFGGPQFLPSTYLRLARDGDGRIDISNDGADTLASIAHYMREAGWRPGLPWGVRASVPAEFDREGVVSRLAAPSCPQAHASPARWLPMRAWRLRGVLPARPLADDTLAALIEPDGPGGSAFLVTANYQALLAYNCSTLYALSVGLLSDAVAQ